MSTFAESLLNETFSTPDVEDAVFGTAPSTSNVEVIFRDPFEVAHLLRANVSDCTPQVDCRTKDVSSYNRGAKVHVRCTDYYIREIQRQEGGITTLLLTEDAG